MAQIYLFIILLSLQACIISDADTYSYFAWQQKMDKWEIKMKGADISTVRYDHQMLFTFKNKKPKITGSCKYYRIEVPRYVRRVLGKKTPNLLHASDGFDVLGVLIFKNKSELCFCGNKLQRINIEGP